MLFLDTDGRPCGFIKLAMAVSKGSLEVEIICATGLLFHGEPESLGESLAVDVKCQHCASCEYIIVKN